MNRLYGYKESVQRYPESSPDDRWCVTCDARKLIKHVQMTPTSAIEHSAPSPPVARRHPASAPGTARDLRRPGSSGVTNLAPDRPTRRSKASLAIVSSLPVSGKLCTICMNGFTLDRKSTRLNSSH